MEHSILRGQSASNVGNSDTDVNITNMKYTEKLQKYTDSALTFSAQAKSFESFFVRLRSWRRQNLPIPMRGYQELPHIRLVNSEEADKQQDYEAGQMQNPRRRNYCAVLLTLFMMTVAVDD